MLSPSQMTWVGTVRVGLGPVYPWLRVLLQGQL